MGSKWLKQVQIGKEVTPGTAVTPTAIWRGPASTPDDVREIVFPEEDVASLPGKDRAYIASLGGEIALAETEATFEQLGYVFRGGIEDAVGVQDGAGTDYIYTFDVPKATQPVIADIQPYTFIGGDGIEQEQMEYGVCSEFSLKGNVKEAVTIESTWFGRQVGVDGFASLSVTTVEEIVAFPKIYIDDASGTIGTTLISNSLRSFELKMTTGWIPRYTGNGELYFSHAVFNRPIITLDLVFDHDANAVLEKADWRALNARLIRLLFEGSDVATAGTVYSKKSLILDVAGKYEKVEPPDEDEEITTQKVLLLAKENDTASLYAQFVIVNELTDLP